MEPKRRCDDNGGTDYKGRRHHEKGLTAWVTGAFAAGVMSVLAFLLVIDRARIEDTGKNALIKATANDKAIAVMSEELTTIQFRLASIEASQTEILKAVKKP